MDNNYLSVCQQLELSGLLLLENKMGSEQSLLEEVKFLQPLSFSFIERCRPAKRSTSRPKGRSMKSVKKTSDSKGKTRG